MVGRLWINYFKLGRDDDITGVCTEEDIEEDIVEGRDTDEEEVDTAPALSGTLGARQLKRVVLSPDFYSSEENEVEVSILLHKSKNVVIRNIKWI